MFTNKTFSISIFTCFCLFSVGDVVCTNDSTIISSTLSRYSLHTKELSQQPLIKRDVHNDNRVQAYSLPNEYSNIYDLLSPTSDFVFYQIFGIEKHKSVLMSLLNSILKGNPHVKDVWIDPTEHKRTTVDGKTIVLDIKATIDDGTIVNVEMQCIDTGSIYARSIYNQSAIVRDNTIVKGQSYDAIPNIISIWIMNENITDRQECIHEAVYMFKKNGKDDIEVMTDVTRHFFIELQKVKSEPQNILNDMFTAWMIFIKDPRIIPQELIDKYQEIREAFQTLDYVSHDRQSRSDYNNRIKALCDFNSANKKSREEGRAEGLVEGKIESAKKMLKDEMPIELIIKYTSLTKEQIEMVSKNISGK